MELLKAFGVDWKLVLANLINFALLVFILYKIGYKPILNFVNDRTKKIEDGIKNAAKSQEALAQAQAQQTQIIEESQKQAQQIINQAKDTASKQANEILEKTKQEAEVLLTKTQSELELQRAQMLKEAKKDITDLVLLTSEKILDKKVDDQTDRDFVNGLVGTLKTTKSA
ncbi:MAG: ATP synthase F0 subunit B [Candidatus Kerfeldbacteria bacterium RIFOXYA2_FULL_38_24]|uniref:ATP synthase subunit b n=1 Tax=Candidatus Kerfeldbacteria bacterium RIFOXYB2_FULL_38_14 TaxID=1798547 RepID=A0A1G2B9V9_9BACT|nr:MAG: ATP synthase F0 subunit B [Candidatus Kerfeldbacteria bacterium RIFOXYA2_FULL_38_24]OGY86008.1 MAG: ATP synthase F0 subunit B [Candidatus Kerfeldbacteria bacterium RIFOXYB2_FULL_38_14]OGY90118.1 MAG: ATP synthase F0 subunit B [Candidatus Kerfeldbacteria bacterium RIFOXYC2_FULL_38_9]